jgi:hypothetical protein
VFVTAVCGGGASSGMSSARALDDIAAAAANIPGTLPDSSDPLIQETLPIVPGGHHGAGLHMPYPTFASGDGSSWTAVMDPSVMAGFGFPGSNMMPGQYIVGSEMIWSQDPLLMGYQFLNPVAIDQTPNMLSDQSIPNSVDSVSHITPAFCSMAVNGSVQGIIPGGQSAVMTSSSDMPSGVENTISTPTTSSSQSESSAPQPEKPKSWAAIASQPAKPRPPPPPKPQPQPEPSPVESNKKHSNPPMRQAPSQSYRGPVLSNNSSSSDVGGSKGTSAKKAPAVGQQQTGLPLASKSKTQPSGIVGKLHSQNKYNPPEMTVNLSNARYFVIKSYAEDDIHRSIKYNMWTSTEHGNRRLDQAFKEQKGKPIYLFYSVNGSGHFCGMAQMMSEVDFHNVTGVWAQDKWKGRFDVKWLYVKDVPNSQLRHIRLENNENKPVTNSRDTQEIPGEKGKQVVRIVHSYVHTTSIFDDFEHYEKKQQEDSQKKK